MEEYIEKQVEEIENKIDRPNDFTDPDVLYDELIETFRKFHPNEDTGLIERAYITAKNAHMDQRRKSGEPYVIHPVCVAIILADLEMDKDTIIAALLHDAIEDTILVKPQLTRVFGEDVANIVDGVTKLTAIDIANNKTEEQAENLRKMFLAMSNDIRVIIVKLADRLHNMRTLKYMKPEKQKEKSRETLDIYSPLAQRLGISRIKTELDDTALRYLEPEAYEDLEKQLSVRMSAKESSIEEIKSEIKGYMDEAEIKVEISGRVKHLFSIYKKMIRQQKPLSQIYDLYAVRIIVDSIKDCYAALGIIHEHYKPVPGRFKDYIAMPKPNMYQSLHTTLIGKDGQPFEVQIRTFEMHRTAEYGIAAHWQYKESGGSTKTASGDELKQMNWLHQLLELQKENADNEEFMSTVKSDLDLFSESVYCFTPTGDVKTLPAGSTPVDFAYSIHSAVGNRMVGARANGQLVNIDYQIKNGDRIEVITSQNSRGPSRDWLKIVKSAGARSKINAWFKSQLKEENIEKGRELIEKYCKAKAIVFSDINRPEIIEKVTKRYAYKDWESMLATIGYGGLKEGAIVNKMVEEYKKIIKKEETDEQVLEVLSEAKNKDNRVKIQRTESGIVVKGLQDLAVRFSHCCNPVPGDEIVGFVTRGRGVSVHRTDCVNIINLPEEERERLISAEWQKNEGDPDSGKYLADITVYAANRMGLMVDISRVLTESGIDILGLSTHLAKTGTATITLSFETRGREELQSIIEKLRQIDNVNDIQRTTG